MQGGSVHRVACSQGFEDSQGKIPFSFFFLIGTWLKETVELDNMNNNSNIAIFLSKK